MINTKPVFIDMINSVSRQFEARVELLNGSTILNTFTYDGALQSITIERAGDESCFFGFGICQKLTLKLRDKERAINVLKGNRLDVSLGVGHDYLYPFPAFDVEEVTRDENTNALTITAYDVIYKANSLKVSDMQLPKSYTILGFATSASPLLGIPIVVDGLTGQDSNVEYPNGANFDGTESIRDALNDVAEATGTIYFVNNNWELVFKKLDIAGDPVLAIDKSKYFTLSAKTKYTLTGITSATELGDNVTVGTTVGSHQYLRDNAFLELRDDIATLLNNIFSKVNGLSMYQFDLAFRGNFLLECGDKISVTTKDNDVINCYILNDTITYNGGLNGKISWAYNAGQGETASNPANIGEAIKQTYARVDKQQKQITLLASDVNSQTEIIKKTVKQVDVEYYLSTSTTSAIGGEWSTTAPEWQSGKYMWSRQKVTYTDGTSITRNATCIAGAQGAEGTNGRGITSVTTEYYISTSQTELVGGEWSEEQPQWEEGKYIWTRSKIVYNNPTSTEYTTAVCDAAWAQSNAITGQQKIITTDISQLKVEKSNISASVATIVEKQSDIDSTIVDMQQGITEQNASNAAQFETLTNKVDATMTSEQVQLAISTEVAKGASKVTTSTGFTFDDNGLTISKSDSEMSTNIDEDGMSIFRNSEEVLTADNTGVNATNLHATTYLIIGTNSRFEDYGSNRTGCFWIGS